MGQSFFDQRTLSKESEQQSKLQHNSQRTNRDGSLGYKSQPSAEN